MDDVAKAINQFSMLMEDQNAKLDAVLELLGDVPKMSDTTSQRVVVERGHATTHPPRTPPD